mgnify:CR=1 FL=1
MCVSVCERGTGGEPRGMRVLALDSLSREPRGVCLAFPRKQTSEKPKEQNEKSKTQKTRNGFGRYGQCITM